MVSTKTPVSYYAHLDTGHSMKVRRGKIGFDGEIEVCNEKEGSVLRGGLRLQMELKSLKKYIYIYICQ